MSKPRASKKSKTADPILEKAQNIILEAGEKRRNEFAGFAEHIANKLSKYDDYTRAQAEFNIMKILFDCDMGNTEIQLRLHRVLLAIAEKELALLNPNIQRCPNTYHDKILGSL